MRSPLPPLAARRVVLQWTTMNLYRPKRGISKDHRVLVAFPQWRRETRITVDAERAAAWGVPLGPYDHIGTEAGVWIYALPGALPLPREVAPHA